MGVRVFEGKVLVELVCFAVVLSRVESCFSFLSYPRRVDALLRFFSFVLSFRFVYQIPISISQLS